MGDCLVCGMTAPSHGVRHDCPFALMSSRHVDTRLGCLHTGRRRLTLERGGLSSLWVERSRLAHGTSA